jgi:hypothetical protein
MVKFPVGRLDASYSRKPGPIHPYQENSLLWKVGTPNLGLTAISI